MTTTTTTTRNTENLESRNWYYKRAKQSADELNKEVKVFSKIVGVELTTEQIRQLMNHAEHFASLTQRADRAYDSYAGFCNRHNYKTRDLNYYYMYVH